MEDKEYKLDWCPFCGSSAVVKDNKNGSYWVRCANPMCMCELGCEDTIEEAVRRWNYREY